MYETFDAFPDSARLWLMAFPRPLDEAERAKVAASFEAFRPHWKVHGTPIESAWTLLEDQILAVVENTMGTQPSGCSIDTMLRQSLKVATILELQILDAQSIIVRASRELKVVAKSDLESLLTDGTLEDRKSVV